MDEFPDPDEEYEIMHLEEMEAMEEMERETNMVHKSSEVKKSKNSLNFFENGDERYDCMELDVNERDDHGVNHLNSKKRSLSNSLIELNSDLEVVEKPVKKQKINIPIDNKKNESNGNPHEYGVTSFRVPNWPFITISTCDGDRLYVKLKRESDDCGNDTSSQYNVEKGKKNLLKVPCTVLRNIIEESYAESLLNSRTDDGQGNENEEEKLIDSSDLWVEKFRPKTYFDLLSDEAVNRTLLNWLKMWDKVVFNKEPKIKFHTKENDFKFNLNKKFDSDGRPYYKIALLCGPPGLGKTTLAHIAAVIAGYNVIEVNASDDRSIEAITSKLNSATQMQTVTGKKKPNCVIFDEIDGAPSQTVDFILKYLGSKQKEKTKDNNNSKKEKNEKTVKRPVICICNELYTPSLRNLRQKAFVIHFPNTSSTKLIQRLMEICKRQEIRTDLTAISLLCDKAQNDIRSCISTLHFFKNKKGERFKSSDVLKSVLGLKDVQKSVFNIWKEIFYNPIQKSGIFAKTLSLFSENKPVSNVRYSKEGMLVIFIFTLLL